MILRVGLTGCIGAGKSVVASMLRDRGCHTIDLDVLGHRLLKAGSSAFADIVAAFGDGIVGEDGDIERAALARLVFEDADARRRLEAISHPRIAAAEAREQAAHEGIVVSEGALLVETGGWRRYHRLVVVIAPAAVRMQRLLARGMAAAQAQARMRTQLPEADKVAVASHVVDNAGTLDGTRQQVAHLWRALNEDLAALRQGRELPPPPRR